MLNENEAKPFTAEDIRFTRKDDALYGIILDWPERDSAVASLGRAALPDAVIERVELLGGPALGFTRDADALRLKIPPADRGEFVPVLKIRGSGFV
jgi:alpha-L-fucosidase